MRFVGSRIARGIGADTWPRLHEDRDPGPTCCYCAGRLQRAWLGHPVLFQRMLAQQSSSGGARMVVIRSAPDDTAGDADLFLGLKAPAPDTACLRDCGAPPAETGELARGL